MAEAPFDLDHERDGERPSVWIVRVRGELDTTTAPQLEARLREVEGQGPALVILDLEATAFIDSSGLRVLVEGDRRMRANGAELVIEGMSAAARRILEISGLLTRLARREP